MFGLGPTELIIIAVIILLIFGAKRIPEIGKGLGGAIKEFKKIKEELSPAEKQGETRKKDEEKEEKTPTLEAKVVDRVLEQVPGVKKVMDVKKKADKIKEIIS